MPQRELSGLTQQTRLTEMKEPAAQGPTTPVFTLELRSVCLQGRALHNTPLTLCAGTLGRAFSHPSLYPDVARELGIIIASIEGSPHPRDTQRWRQSRLA